MQYIGALFTMTSATFHFMRLLADYHVNDSSDSSRHKEHCENTEEAPFWRAGELFERMERMIGCYS
jgi:hypothetical protein